LREHPEVFLPSAKEIHFFDEHYHEGLAWYSQHFNPRPGQKKVGEINPNYLDWEPAINRIARDIPNALLFVILRNPVERAVSAYHFFRETLFPGQSFAQACRNSVYLVKLGLYATHLKRVFVYFPRRQVKILFYDDVQQKPARVVADLYRFLGVDHEYVPRSLRVVYNSAYFPTKTIAWKRAICGWASRLIKDTPLGRWARRSFAPKRVHNYDGIAERDLVALVEAFREDIEELEEMTGRDLSSWLALSGTRRTHFVPNWQGASPGRRLSETDARVLRPVEVYA
jgi:hypothetical protein